MGIEQLRANSADGIPPPPFVLEIDWSEPNHYPRIVGPFATKDDADEWATDNIRSGEWNVAPLARPYEDV